MLDADTARQPPPVAQAPSERQRARTRDRRTAWTDFLEYLTAALHTHRDPRELRERFQEGLRRLVAARRLALRRGPVNHPPQAATTRRLTFPVPDVGEERMVIDTVFDARSSLDGWDVQTLEGARYLAAFVLEVERCRLAMPPARPRPEESLPLIGSGAGISALRERISRVALTDFTVLIEGESGAGKELVARHIHEHSHRRNGPFVAVNCAAIVETLLEAELFGIEDRTATGVKGRRGKFELADEGTLFLDEVSDLTSSAQSKLLRAIQDLAVERVGGHGTRRIDTRIVAATNRSLLELVERGQFRADLYYRLNGVEIRVPPLRDRREDIPELARHFLDRHRHVRHLKLTAPALDALLAYDWPGNVRELERVMERAIALARSDEILLEDLPPLLARGYEEALMPALVRDETLRTWGCRYARLVLERHNNNKRSACRALGISYHTLRTYLRNHPRRPRANADAPSAEEPPEPDPS